jgi:hypothetical protein
VLARILEEHGLSAVSLSLIREHTAKIKPPRAVWVPFPFGMSVGHRHDVAEQQAVLALAFSTLDAPAGPVLLDFDARPRNERAAPLQASEVEIDPAASERDLASEAKALRERWTKAGLSASTHAGASGIPPAQFDAMVTFLEAYVAGTADDFPARPAAIALPAFIRYAVEDLRVLYMELRMREVPEESSDDRQHWLLGSTALGVFVRKLRDRMEASDDAKMRGAAFGIAR